MNKQEPFSHFVISIIISLIITYIVTRWLLLKFLPDVPFNWIFLSIIIIIYSLLFIGMGIYRSRKSEITENTFINHKNTYNWNVIEKVTIKKSEIGNPYLTLYFKDNSPPRGFDIEYMNKANFIDDLQEIALQFGFALEIDDDVMPLLEETPQEDLSFLESLQENFKRTREEAKQKEAEKKSKNVPEINITPRQKNCIIIILAVVFFLWLFIEFDTELGVYIIIILLVHEGGHLIAMRFFHLKTEMVIFIPFVGAGIIPREGFKSPEMEAAVALTGPLAGLSLNVMGLVLYDNLAFFAQHDYYPFITMLFKFLLYCLPLNFLINLANLLPLSPLDGGRIVKSALLRGKKSLILFLVFTAIIGILITILLKSIIIAIILLIGVSTIIQHYRSLKKLEMDPPSWKMTLLILGAWILIISLYWVTLHPYSRVTLTNLFPYL